MYTNAVFMNFIALSAISNLENIYLNDKKKCYEKNNVFIIHAARSLEKIKT